MITGGGKQFGGVWHALSIDRNPPDSAATSTTVHELAIEHSAEMPSVAVAGTSATQAGGRSREGGRPDGTCCDCRPHVLSFSLTKDRMRTRCPHHVSLLP